MDLECRICGHNGPVKMYKPREMMFGTRERFDYFQCQLCGCLQIRTILPEMSIYYPSNYFSFHDYSGLMRSRLRRWLEFARVALAFGAAKLGGPRFGRLLPVPNYMQWILRAGITRDASILDVGCGSGKLLVRLGLAGFKECLGVDPYLGKDIVYSPHVRILNKQLHELIDLYPKHFSLIMLHHSFEHMSNPHAVLDMLVRLLRPGGCLLLRIPLAEGYAWETYKEDWVQLDAPRHFYLHTVNSIKRLAQSHGLMLQDIIYDSGPTQILGSELYRHDIALTADDNLKKVVMTPTLKKSAAVLADKLNKAGRGDQAAFILADIQGQSSIS